MPYQIAIAGAKPAGVMCAFNQYNREYSCQNQSLLTDYLRKDLNFQGFVTTDNGAQKSTAPSLLAGLSQELGTPRFFTPDNLHAAIDAGLITAAQIRAAAFKVVRAKFAEGLMDRVLPTSGRFDDQRTPEHHAVALRNAEEGSVLLKNKANLLPLSGTLAPHGKTIAVIGPTASNTPTAAGISAKTVCTSPLYGRAGAPPVVDCPNPSAPLDAIQARAAQDGDTVIYNDGTDPTSAAQTAASADVAVVLGYNTAGEYYDQTTNNLFSNGDAVIDAVATANKNTVVVLETAGSVLMPWLDKVKSVMEAWWPGEAGGQAIAELLWGDVNFSGKLPVTFPRAVADLPTGTPPNDQYPGVFSDGSTTRPAGSTEIRQVNYTEGLEVGYRYYDAHGITPMFAFGHGLSYTKFTYSNMSVNTRTDQVTGAVSSTVRFTVKNDGKVAGAEVPQLYLTFPSAAQEPGKRLIGFDRISLGAGERRTVSFVVNSAAANKPFSVWDTARSAWKTVDGRYSFTVGSSSRDLRLKQSVAIDANPPVATAPPAITGTPNVGRNLHATRGAWSEGGLQYAYQWLREGAPIRGATQSDYRVTLADQLKHLSVRVTAIPKSGPVGTSTSAAVFVPSEATVSATPQPGIGTPSTVFKVNVRVKPSAPATTAQGEMTVVVEGVSFVATLVNGAVTVPIGSQPVGRHKISVTYGGSGEVRTASTATSIRVVNS